MSFAMAVIRICRQNYALAFFLTALRCRDLLRAGDVRSLEICALRMCKCTCREPERRRGER